ncbi:hypothetical protein RWE15_06295 [Virgibacillus halophilus]|uniref:Zinc ribbon domain-containing protein n=1 Tax=Tigheibacillus halophilus TaxID=361280 RepID=A0ABU5C511_9BACI|nr:hypothetical protein [Virgibacillus halophilus]
MKCINCGFEQQEGKFCGKCGSPMTVEKAQPEEQKIDQHQHVPTEDVQQQTVNQPERPQQFTYEEAVTTATATDSHNDAMDKMKYTSKAFLGLFRAASETAIRYIS